MGPPSFYRYGAVSPFRTTEWKEEAKVEWEHGHIPFQGLLITSWKRSNRSPRLGQEHKRAETLAGWGRGDRKKERRRENLGEKKTLAALSPGASAGGLKRKGCRILAGRHIAAGRSGAARRRGPWTGK